MMKKFEGTDAVKTKKKTRSEHYHHLFKDVGDAAGIRRLKGALIAAKRLQATDLPEFEAA